MSPIEQAGGFVHEPTQRTGYLTDGPFHEFDKSGPKPPRGERWPIIETWYECKWDDTGEIGEVKNSEIRMIPAHQRHITDGVRICHCGPSEIEGIVVHRSTEELN